MRLRHVTIIAACLASVGLTGCETLPFTVNAKAAPEAQATQAQANADFIKALAARLEHCGLNGAGNFGIGGLAGSGTGVSNSVTFNCPAKPWEVPPT